MTHCSSIIAHDSHLHCTIGGIPRTGNADYLGNNLFVAYPPDDAGSGRGRPHMSARVYNMRNSQGFVVRGRLPRLERGQDRVPASRHNSGVGAIWWCRALTEAMRPLRAYRTV